MRGAEILYGEKLNKRRAELCLVSYVHVYMYIHVLHVHVRVRSYVYSIHVCS